MKVTAIVYEISIEFCCNYHFNIFEHDEQILWSQNYRKQYVIRILF